MLALRGKAGRDLAVLGASWLDIILEQNLLANMAELSSDERDDLFDGRGVLATTSAKINVARSFGLISAEARTQSKLLNRVRNLFAHTIEDLDTDSPAIAAIVDKMTFTYESAMQFITIDPDANRDLSHGAFNFDGETFDSDDVSTIVEPHPESVLFFLPKVAIETRDDRLRSQIYACVIGAAGIGLKPWIESSAPRGGIVEMVA